MKKLFPVCGKRTSAIFLLAAISVTAFIFYNSLKAGDASAKQSDAVSGIFKRMFSPFGISVNDAVLTVVIRKAAHFTEYFALGAFSFLACGAFGNAFVGLIPPFYCLCIAVCDEFLIQAMTEGRAPMWTDVLIDLSGAVAAVAVISALCIHKRKKANSKL